MHVKTSVIGRNGAALSLQHIAAIGDVETPIRKPKAHRLYAARIKRSNASQRPIMADAESGNRIASLIHREQESSIRAGDHFLIRIVRPKALRRITLPGAAGQKLPDWAQRAIRGIASEGDHRVLPRLRVLRFHKNKF